MIEIVKTQYGPCPKFKTCIHVGDDELISSKDFNDAINDSAWTSETDYRTYRIRSFFEGGEVMLTISCEEVGITKTWKVTNA
jgi:hypothetical protein